MPRFLDEDTSRAIFAPAAGTWETLTLPSGRKWVGHGEVPQAMEWGPLVFIRGRIAPTSGSFTNGSTYDLVTIPAEHMPRSVAGGLGQVMSFVNPGYARLELNTATRMLQAAPSRDTDWIGIDGLFWFKN